MATASLAFLGAGNMCSSIIGGLIAEGYDAQKITATRRSQAPLKAMQDEWGICTRTDNTSAVADNDVIILGVKPQMMKALCDEIRDQVQISKPLVISVAAGLTAQTLERWLGGDVAVIRTMPNTPSLLRCGATGLFANAVVSNEQKALAENIMQATGIALWVDKEELMEAVTGVSGSGPAYFFLMMEAMQQAGEAVGLTPEVARQLTLQTALGAARMATESDVEPAELRRRVTSPGGTTEQAIKTFNEGDLTGLFEKAVKASANRGKELAELLDQ